MHMKDGVTDKTVAANGQADCCEANECFTSAAFQCSDTEHAKELKSIDTKNIKSKDDCCDANQCEDAVFTCVAEDGLKASASPNDPPKLDQKVPDCCNYLTCGDFSCGDTARKKSTLPTPDANNVITQANSRDKCCEPLTCDMFPCSQDEIKVKDAPKTVTAKTDW